MSILEQLDWKSVAEQYATRFDMHRRLISLQDSGPTNSFVTLVLGIDEPAGNYSAWEHNLGPKILSLNTNATPRISDLCKRFRLMTSAKQVAPAIKAASLKFLQIGVGSEASCMINPAVCWVANTRTIWTHLVIKHGDDVAKANEELSLYRDSDQSSEMAYRIWTEIHQELGVSMTRIAALGDHIARRAGVEPGPVKYIWADAIANSLYETLA